MLTLALALTACKKGDALPDGVPVDCLQSPTTGNVFTVSGSAPYEWAYDDKTVDTTGRIVTSHPDDLVLTLSDGTEHVANHNANQLYDGEQSLYRGVGTVLERSDDLGVTWNPTNAPVDPHADINGRNLAVRGSNVLLWTPSLENEGIQISTNRGETWQPVRYPLADGAVASDISWADVNSSGRVVVSRQRVNHGTPDVMWSDDFGQTWEMLVIDDRDVSWYYDVGPAANLVAVEDDGRIWFAGLDGIFWTDDGVTFDGGPAVTELHASGTEDPLGFIHLAPQSDGRMGFVSRAGLGGFAGQVYCVVGPDAAGLVVPDVEAEPGPVEFTPGKLVVVAQLPAASDFAVIDGELATMVVNTSFDSLANTVSFPSGTALSTHDDRPAGSAEGLVPVDITTHPNTGNPILSLQATQFTDLVLSGEIWELTKSGTPTGQVWVIGVDGTGTQHLPRAAFPGPGTMFVRTTGGVYDADSGALLEAAGDVGIDPVNGDIFYPTQSGYIGRSTSGASGIYNARCADATESTQDCYDTDGYTIWELRVSPDRYLYGNAYDRIVRRPIDDPSQGWELVADGFSGLGRMELDTYEGDPRLWFSDQGTVWAGVIGDTLPLTR